MTSKRTPYHNIKWRGTIKNNEVNTATDARAISIAAGGFWFLHLCISYRRSLVGCRCYVFQLSLTDVLTGYFYRLSSNKPFFPASEHIERMPRQLQLMPPLSDVMWKHKGYVEHAGDAYQNHSLPPPVQQPIFVIGFDGHQNSCFSMHLKSKFQPILWIIGI